MKHKKTWLWLALLVIVLAAGFYFLWQSHRPQGRAGEKEFTVEVIHKDGTRKSFARTSDQEMLGDAITDLVSGTEGQYGLYVTEVDGESADFDKDGSWWKLQVNGEDATSGADSLPIENGATYSWIYTTGE